MDKINKLIDEIIQLSKQFELGKFTNIGTTEKIYISKYGNSYYIYIVFDENNDITRDFSNNYEIKFIERQTQDNIINRLKKIKGILERNYVEEMTLEQICNKLGKNIKIIK